MDLRLRSQNTFVLTFWLVFLFSSSLIDQSKNSMVSYFGGNVHYYRNISCFVRLFRSRVHLYASMEHSFYIDINKLFPCSTLKMLFVILPISCKKKKRIIPHFLHILANG